MKHKRGPEDPAAMEQSSLPFQPVIAIVSAAEQLAFSASSYQPAAMVATETPALIGATSTANHPTASFPDSPAHLSSQHQLAYQQVQQLHHHHHHQLHAFWARQIDEIEQTMDFKNHTLPLARIKKIMKADEAVRMISAEAPVIFAKACEIFILELTLRSWIQTEENKRRTLQKNDIAAAITRTDIFDFLVDIVPRDEFKEESLGIPRAALPVVGASADSIPYYHVPARHQVAGQRMAATVDQRDTRLSDCASSDELHMAATVGAAHPAATTTISAAVGHLWWLSVT